jgi:digalactosyldiacylglycerol synthase
MGRIALIARSLLDRENPSLEQEEHLAVYDEGFLETVTPQSDLTRPGRYIHVVTTAALPWFTGTAVNPLLRAASLYRRTQEINRNETATDDDDPQSWVILVIPWLELPEDQELLYGQVFSNTTEQEVYIRNWLRKEANMPDVADHLDIIFYPARYHTGLRSIFAMGDLL